MKNMHVTQITHSQTHIQAYYTQVQSAKVRDERTAVNATSEISITLTEADCRSRLTTIEIATNLRMGEAIRLPLCPGIACQSVLVMQCA